MSDYKPKELHSAYTVAIFPRKQSRDCLDGPHVIKNNGEFYLPMPSGWHEIEAESPSVNRPTKVAEGVDLGAVNAIMNSYTPWNHPNPAYRAYLQRARFPDISANALRASVGIVCKREPSWELPSKLDELAEDCTTKGKGLTEFFEEMVTEVLSSGNAGVIVDFDVDLKRFYLSMYTGESAINWDEFYSHGQEDYYRVTLFDGDDYFDYKFNSKGEVVCDKFPQDGDETDADSIEALAVYGKKLDRIPFFAAGSDKNTIFPRPIPLQGIEDIAISIYQKNADLAQAHFLTCNPTLFLFGTSEKPEVVGSQVIVTIEESEGRAEYPKTDSAALKAVDDHIEKMYVEAAVYGANLLTSGQKESGDALSIRQANRGANLVKVVLNCAKAIEDALKYIAKLSGSNPSEVKFNGNIEFAEKEITAQDIAVLLSAWSQGGAPLDIVLDALRAGGWIKPEITNEEIKKIIQDEMV